MQVELKFVSEEEFPLEIPHVQLSGTENLYGITGRVVAFPVVEQQATAIPLPLPNAS